MKIQVSLSKQLYFRGTCVNSFDDDGQANSSIPYSDVSEFAQAEEDSTEISRQQFIAVVKDISSEVEKIYNNPKTKFLLDHKNSVYMMYDPRKDIHYFYL